jgi:DNA-binding transcriptional ArsR family regulator
MNDRHREQHALLASLGAPSRFRIALCLLEGDRCVGDLAVAIGLSQSCTTRHVQALERHGVVRSRRDGKRVLVALELARAGLAEVLGIAAGAADAMPRLAAPAIERKARKPRTQGERSARATRTTSAPRPPRAPAPVELRAADETPSVAPSSGTHATPVEDQSFHPRRPRETLEDFLL